MPEKMTKITMPNGVVVDGSEVPIKETTERWTDILLEDGTALRLKVNVLSATRIDGQYDPEGNPMYALKSSQVMTVASAPAHLRKNPAEAIKGVN